MDPADRRVVVPGYPLAVDRSPALSPKYIGVLALAASLILAVGWLVRPREIPPAPLPTENELAQLARRSERRSLDAMTEHFAAVADDVDAAVVYLPGVEASGVALSAGAIVTVPLPRHPAPEVTIQLPSGEGRAQLTIWGPQLPLAAVATDGGLPGLIVARDAASLPETGAWVLAVWRAGLERGFAPGSYVQTASVVCDGVPVREVMSSLVLNRVMAGGGLFDIDGNLLAVVLRCDDRFAAVATDSILPILAAADTVERRVLARYGLVFTAFGDDERAYFKTTDGVMVREVWIGSPGDVAGLRPGDVVAALDGVAVVAQADVVAPLVASGTRTFALTVRRRLQSVPLVLSTDVQTGSRTADADPDAGLVWESPPRYRIDSVTPGSRAAKAGLEPGDRLVGINYAAPRNQAQVERILAGDGASRALIEVERDGRRLALVW